MTTSPTRPVTGEEPAGEAVDLAINGMTCASCATRVEKKLNRLAAVRASVNFATEKAHIVLPEGVSAQEAIAVVEASRRRRDERAGYGYGHRGA